MVCVLRDFDIHRRSHWPIGPRYEKRRMASINILLRCQAMSKGRKLGQASTTVAHYLISCNMALSGRGWLGREYCRHGCQTNSWLGWSIRTDDGPLWRLFRPA